MTNKMNESNIIQQSTGTISQISPKSNETNLEEIDVCKKATENKPYKFQNNVDDLTLLTFLVKVNLKLKLT